MSMRDFRFALLVSGSGTTAEAIVKECRAGERLSHIAPVCVIASKTGSGAIEKMKQLGIPEKDILVIDPKQFSKEEDFGNAILRALRERNVTLVGQYGWLIKTPKNVIQAYQGSILNQHPGPLDPGRPDFGGKGMYGRRVNASRMYFVRKTNHDFWTEATAQRAAEDFDAGKVLRRKQVEILPDDTLETLQARLLPVEHEIQIQALEDFMHGRVKELERDTPLVKPDEIPILEESKKAAIKEYPNG